MPALKTPSSGAALAIAVVLALSGCSKQAPKAEDIRPVRALRIGGEQIDTTSAFSGEVRPRIESRLGFRVGGKITERRVDVGSPVTRGQVLMRLDPQDLQLAASQAGAALRAAQTNRDLAQADLKRYADLRGQNFVSQAVLDAKRAAYQAAQANVDAAQAALRGHANQANYTSLVSDIDGVVTAVEAEAGQVVAAGTPVVRVARAGEKEVVIGVPEDRVDSVRNIKDVTVRLWADPTQPIAGRIREVSPVADPLTRTYAVKVSMLAPPPSVKLGMTASVQFASRSSTPQVRLPLTALFQQAGGTAVWLVEQGKVHLVPVKVGGVSGNDLLVSSGVKPGQTVVTAGVHQLKEGQKVRILGVDVPAPTASGSRGMAGGGEAK